MLSYRLEGLECCGEALSPVLHLRLTRPSPSRQSDEQLLQSIADECLSNGVAVVTAKYLDEEYNLPPPRFVVCSN